jgi:hypothetical protein
MPLDGATRRGLAAAGAQAAPGSALQAIDVRAFGARGDGEVLCTLLTGPIEE